MATNYLSMIPNAMAQGQMSQVSPVQWGQAMGKMYQDKKQKDLESNAMLAAQQAFQSKDPNAIAQLMITNPDLADRVSKGIAFQSDATRQNLVGSIEGILANPSNTEQIIKDRIAMVDAAGGDSTQSRAALAEYKSDPEGFMRNAEIAYSIYAPDKSKLYQEAKTQGQMTPYQQAQIESGDLDRELRKQEIELRRLEMEGKRAKTTQEQDAKAQQIEQKRAEIDEKKAQDKTRIDNGINTATQNKQAIDDLLGNDDYMSSLTGYTGRIPAVTTTGVEAEAYLDNIKNSMTIDNLGVMSGPLTDKDIQIIASASSRLRSGMSEAALKKELNTIKKAYDRVINNYRKEANRKGYKQESDSLSDAQLLDMY